MKYALRMCDSVAFRALHMARIYFMGGRNKELLFETLGRDPATESMASGLFKEAELGLVSHHADFSANQLYSCAASHSVSVGQPKEKARICLARVDIPFFLLLARDAGKPQAEAIQSVSGTLADRGIYPGELIRAVAGPVYASRSMEQDQETMGITFWACMNAS